MGERSEEMATRTIKVGTLEPSSNNEKLRLFLTEPCFCRILILGDGMELTAAVLREIWNRDVYVVRTEAEARSVCEYIKGETGANVKETAVHI
jgi:hypothetical protein